MADEPRHVEALALVHRGWDQLRLERPLAAWADWQQALRLVPGDRAAIEALDRLASAPDLPALARKDFRFQPPGDDAARERWNVCFQNADLENLDRAATAFASLADSDPGDLAAWRNLALCRAWRGDNRAAITALERLVQAAAGPNPATAQEAWALAEILRAGAGAEVLADDLSHAATIPLGPDDGDPTAVLPNLLPVTLSGDLPLAEARVFEWLDRPMPRDERNWNARDLPLVLATVVLTPGQLRLSSPDPAAVGEALELLGPLRDRAERTATPLPLRLLDASLWTFRLPPGLDATTRCQLTRESIEHRLENVWIHWPRQGLGNRSPREAARAASQGDLTARAQLEGVVQLRAELGARPRLAELYAGYPFERLRRRLGLPIEEASAIDPDDFSCASLDELRALEVSQLNDIRLADAYLSAVGLLEDSLISTLGEALLARGSKASALVELRPLFAALVRQALSRDDEAGALAWLEQASDQDDGHRDDYGTWRAEIQARAGDPDSATRSFEAILDRSRDPAQALAASETLRVTGYPDYALVLALRAREYARDSAETARAEGMIASLRDGLAT